MLSMGKSTISMGHGFKFANCNSHYQRLFIHYIPYEITIEILDFPMKNDGSFHGFPMKNGGSPMKKRMKSTRFPSFFAARSQCFGIKPYVCTVEVYPMSTNTLIFKYWLVVWNMIFSYPQVGRF